MDGTANPTGDNLNPATDFQLLAAWREGDRGAANRLLRRHFASLYRFFRNKVDADADELIQRTLVASLAAADQFRGASSFRTYLFTIARHELYRFVRRGRGSEVDFGLSSVIDLGASPSAVIGRRRRQKIVLLALRRLPLELQVVLELHYWEELTAREIAEILELPLGTAKTRIARAKERMLELVPEMLESDAATATTTDHLDAWVASIRNEISGLATAEDRRVR